MATQPMGLLLLLLPPAALAQGPGIPTTAFPPLCSIAPPALAANRGSRVLNITDGTHPRCISVIVPTGAGPFPVLFDFHGAGGNAGNFGMRSDGLGASWSALAAEHNFVVVGGEALQWTAGHSGPPGPGPPAAGCVSCFKQKGCSASQGAAACERCMEAHRFGPGSCEPICEAEHVQWPVAQRDVCSAHGAESPPGQRRQLAERQSHWHGGQWLVPEVQTDRTGLVCDWNSNLDLKYIRAAIAALEAEGAKAGGRLFALDNIFFTGCSMGSAYTICENRSSLNSSAQISLTDRFCQQGWRSACTS